MSAVAPTPPPRPISSRSTSSNALHGRVTGMRKGGNANGSSRPPYPHVKDLLAQAQDEVAQTGHLPINRLIDQAHLACEDAFEMLGRHKSAVAYRQYLVANLYITEAIPKHKDFRAAKAHARLSSVYKAMIKKIHENHAEFDLLEKEISQDNARNGTVQLYRNSQTASPPINLQKSRPHSMQVSAHETSRGLDQSQNKRYTVDLQANGVQGPITGFRTRPNPGPEPPHRESGHSSGGSGADALSDRFARLRMPNGGSTKSQQNGSASDAPLEISTSIEAGHALPTPPTPTYTPSRAPPGPPPPPPAPQHQRIAAASSNGNDRPDSRGSIDSNASFQANGAGVRNVNDNQSSLSHPSRLPPSPPRSRRTVAKTDDEISAELLFDYLRTFTIMLIDVRSRESFDNGHIMASSIICIEPDIVNESMSAEDLEEALAHSPETEQACFQRRDQFDLIVLYDDGEDSDPHPAVEHIRFALSKVGDDRLLHHPPILLKGGLLAWVDLLGPNALQSSNTKAQVGAKGRPIARRPPASSTSRLAVQRKKLRDYNPLDPEEEKKWRERARSESLVVDAQILQDAPAEQISDEEPYSPSLQDFEQKFPDLGALSQEFGRREQAPSRPPPQIPTYPVAPSSNYTYTSPRPLSPPELPSAPPPRPPPPPHASRSPGPPPVPARPPPAAQRPSYSGVSERIVAPTVVTQSKQLPPYIPPKFRRLPRTGLYNFSITCYMNATIQCLSATLPLTAFFLDNQFIRYMQKENWKGSKGVLPELYTTLIKNLWLANDVDTIRPTNFRKFCARLNREWGIDRQQDAKEFLEFLIDCLHEDFNINWQRNPLRALTEGEEARRERMPTMVASKTEWERYLHRDHSKLTDLFAGQHISRLTCTTCHHSSTTYEPFWSVSVEIPKVPHAVSIYDCLKSYCSEEKLSGDEVWRCPRCKAEREATKRITITRVPEFLVVHFKRFSASHAERARKITTPIDFPLEGLNMEPFVNPLPPPAQLKELLAYDPNLMTPAVTPPFKYEAYAVMRHIGGTLTSGHYIALVRDRARGVWREFDDSRVTDFRPEKLSPQYRLQNEQAYIVFYQRSV